MLETVPVVHSGLTGESEVFIVLLINWPHFISFTLRAYVERRHSKIAPSASNQLVTETLELNAFDEFYSYSTCHKKIYKIRRISVENLCGFRMDSVKLLCS